jgi:hypothetical protein
MKVDEENLAQDKLNLIQWICQIQDPAIIQKLNDIVFNNIEVPQWQKDEVLRRIAEHDKNPEKAIDFDQAMDDLKDKFGLE